MPATPVLVEHVDAALVVDGGRTRPHVSISYRRAPDAPAETLTSASWALLGDDVPALRRALAKGPTAALLLDVPVDDDGATRLAVWPDLPALAVA